MKKLTATLLALSFVFVIIYANNNPEVKENVFSIEAISFEMNKLDYDKWGINVEYSAVDETFELSTENQIQFLQVLKADGTIEFQLPLFSNEVTLDLGDFETGDYQLNLIMTDDQIVSSTFSK